MARSCRAEIKMLEAQGTIKNPSNDNDDHCKHCTRGLESYARLPAIAKQNQNGRVARDSVLNEQCDQLFSLGVIHEEEALAKKYHDAS
mmetsp:Transcript_98860/g.194210  ORF Transcript_98860/g.194210 Transcript_98860/m.194210 type:complete len:88 (-) Transcript_98860:240-503(-)